MENKPKNVSNFIKRIQKFCEEKGILVPTYENDPRPMVIIPSKSLEEKFKKHHELQKQKEKEKESI